MHLGPHKLDNALIVAPMAGVTDRPFRVLCRRLGAGLAVSEMVTADASLYGTRKTVRRLDHRGETGPISVQIVGTEPDTMAQAARVNVAHGAQIIDINMGCPAKKVCKLAAGSALMRDEDLVRRILDQVVAAVDVPVTLKMRTGWDSANRNAPRIARLAEQAGISALAVHGRTRACGYRGEAEYDTLTQVKHAVSIPVIANGDIDSPAKAAQVLRQTGADGLMIGRAAQGRPWIFGEITHYLATGELLPEPSPAWIRDTLLEHLAALYELYGSEHGVKVARKHIAWYSRTQPGGAAFRQRINAATTTKQQSDQIRDFFDRLNDKKAPGPGPAPEKEELAA
ncbi:MAG: tRNA dihydrouridine synthase DusB [Gammaproteobacteria bacterium]|nr:tRNA dihydrouridine synthase DusB [Gammaproteobacteria bacterium]